jgi:hypothetical protein
MEKYEQIIKLLNIKVAKQTTLETTSYHVETPLNIKTLLGHTTWVYCFKTEQEVEAFIDGYSLVAMNLIKNFHSTETKD